MLNTIKISLLVVVILFVNACTKLNMQNYEQLKMGMSLKEAEAVIGQATKCSDAVGTKHCIWGNEEAKHIKINFAAGRAVLFSHQGLE